MNWELFLLLPTSPLILISFFVEHILQILCNHFSGRVVIITQGQFIALIQMFFRIIVFFLTWLDRVLLYHMLFVSATALGSVKLFTFLNIFRQSHSLSHFICKIHLKRLGFLVFSLSFKLNNLFLVSGFRACLILHWVLKWSCCIWLIVGFLFRAIKLRLECLRLFIKLGGVPVSDHGIGQLVIFFLILQ